MAGGDLALVRPVSPDGSDGKYDRTTIRSSASTNGIGAPPRGLKGGGGPKAGVNPKIETLVIGTACGERNCEWQRRERAWEVPQSFPEDGSGAAEELRQHCALSEELGVHRRLLYKWRNPWEPIDDAEAPSENTNER